jgi:hypothetical protein
MAERKRGPDGRLLPGDIPRSTPASPATMRRAANGQYVACKRRKDQFDDERRAIFFATLSVTSNVKRSANAAGLSVTTAYRERDREPAFRAQWEQALAEGYAHLELEMLHRARFGVKTTVSDTADGAAKKRSVKHGYSDTVAMALLSRHRETAARGRGVRDTHPPEGAPGADDDALKIARLAALLAALPCDGADGAE